MRAQSSRDVACVPGEIARIDRGSEGDSVGFALFVQKLVKERYVAQLRVYVPEPEFCFYRFGFYSEFAPYSCPSNETNIYTETSYSKNSKPDFKKIEKDTISGLCKAGVINDESDVVMTKALNLNPAYVIFDHKRNASVETIQAFLKENNIASIGRYGAWEYSSMEDAILIGKKTAEELRT